MHVAFDATVLHGRKSGVGYYCEEVLRSMAMLDHSTRFFVFSHLPLRLDFPGVNGTIRHSEKPYCSVRAFYLHALLPRVLDRVEPDLCHYTNFLAPMTESRPYVVTIHDMGLESLRRCHPLVKRLYTRNLIPRVAHRARLILTNSEYSKWEIVRCLGISEGRIRVTPLAASPQFRPVRSEAPRRVPYFLYVGNIEPRKNLGRLIDAYAQLKDLDHELWIVGNSWYRAGEIRERVLERGVEERVRFLGYVPRGDLPGLYSNATAFVYPSLLEGFGLPVLEAMACGTPVITSDSSSLQEVSGNAAYLVDPLDVSALSRAMRVLAESPQERSRLSERGLRRASEFSWERTAQLTLEAYREAAGSPTPRPAVHNAPDSDIAAAIRKTVDYAALFDYPLRRDELYERLFDVRSDRPAFDRVLDCGEFERFGDFITKDASSIDRRALRERVTDQAIQAARPGLRFIASIPFVRMVAFSGATAHRNMSTSEDLDLFIVAEDGKVWLAFLTAMIWAKMFGLRKTYCVNYVISDAALPLPDYDPFTAQQIASLKPFFGKPCYDRFIEMNPFFRRRFPNFDPALHREAYPELQPSPLKRWVERALRMGPAWLAERLSRLALSWHFRRKLRSVALEGAPRDVRIEPRRMKLHFHDHKKDVLHQGFARL